MFGIGINWSRKARKAVRSSTRWATKPYRESKKEKATAKRRRKTWRSSSW